MEAPELTGRIAVERESRKRVHKAVACGYCSDKRFGYFWATAKVSRKLELRKLLHTNASAAQQLKLSTMEKSVKLNK